MLWASPHLQEMKERLAEQLDAGGREADSAAGRRLAELVRHVRIMRPCRLVCPAQRVSGKLHALGCVGCVGCDRCLCGLCTCVTAQQARHHSPLIYSCGPSSVDSLRAGATS
jgi:hypothetical protein